MRGQRLNALFAVFAGTLFCLVACSGGTGPGGIGTTPNSPFPVAKPQGDISSAGGDVYGDTLNPWFLENTQTVSYCIEVDSGNFHLSSTRISEIITEAIESWKAGYKAANSNWYLPGELVPFGQVRIATQSFVKEECSPTTAVRFQFGVLTEEQKKEAIHEPTRVVAAAVRTDYDKVNLRGRGFIYVAPDSGTLRPSTPDMASDVWSFGDGIILKRVLLHELGHVFGLTHSRTAYDLMGAEQPEFIVQKSTLDNLRQSPLPNVKTFLSRVGIFGFQFPDEKEVCDPPGAISLGQSTVDLFFGIPEGTHCRKFKFMQDSIEVYAASRKGDDYALIGKTRSVVPGNSSSVLQRIKLTPEQKVFQKIPNRNVIEGYLDGPAAIRRKVFRTYYDSVDGKRSGVVKAALLPNQLIEMEAVWNDQIVEVFDHGG